MDPLFDISNKVVLISGGSRGIGQGGWLKDLPLVSSRVIITGRDESTLQTQANELARLGAAVDWRVCDVANIEAIESCVQSVMEQFERIDVLLNVAGVNIRQPSLQFTPEQYDFVVDINQKGAFFMAQEVGRRMIECGGGGSIINIDSLNTYAPVRNVLPYAMSKNAIIAMTRSLAMEWGPKGIRVNTIAPGFILTDLTEKLWADPAMLDWGITNTPLGRLGRPDDLVGAAVFLASNASAFMSGQVIRVDGGFTAGLNWPIPDDGGQ